MAKGLIDEDEKCKLEEIIQDYYFVLSEKQIKKLERFKERVDKALEEKDSAKLKRLVRERDKITSEESEEDKNLKKCFSFIINRNPLYIKLNMKEIRELFG